MRGWGPANAARTRATDEKRDRLAAALASSRTFKEAAWRAGIPVRTAGRLLPASAR